MTNPTEREYVRDRFLRFSDRLWIKGISESASDLILELTVYETQMDESIKQEREMEDGRYMSWIIEFCGNINEFYQKVSW